MTNKLKSIAQTYMSMQEKKDDDFKPHMMYDPKTGKGYKAEKPEDHERMSKMGYTHDKPKEDASNDKSDDGEGLDKVDPKAAKKKFKDRKDKDIDNDGDVDDSDEFLHKRRKAIGKSMKGESTVLKSYVEIMQEDKAKASHTASPKADEVEPEENPDLPTQKDMAPNTKKALDMHRKGEKRDYPADKNPKGTEKMKQAAKPKTLKDIRR
tara:strand:- start:287 stop:913 length:627 start_codon:yes stop_codon:yes gene_type:complete